MFYTTRKDAVCVLEASNRKSSWSSAALYWRNLEDEEALAPRNSSPSSSLLKVLLRQGWKLSHTSLYIFSFSSILGVLYQAKWLWWRSSWKSCGRPLGTFGSWRCSKRHSSLQSRSLQVNEKILLPYLLGVWMPNKQSDWLSPYSSVAASGSLASVMLLVQRTLLIDSNHIEKVF